MLFNKYKNWLVSGTVLTALLSLSACSTFSPQAFGISEAEWKTYDQEKQQELLNLYKQQEEQKKIEARQAKAQKNKVFTNAKNKLIVSVTGGKAIMPPFTSWYAYQQYRPLAIGPEACADTILQKVPFNPKVKPKENELIMLHACYIKGTLFLDPSRFEANKMAGTASFRFSPLWDRGFTYDHITTSGYVRLKNANITIRSIDNN